MSSNEEKIQRTAEAVQRVMQAKETVSSIVKEDDLAHIAGFIKDLSALANLGSGTLIPSEECPSHWCLVMGFGRDVKDWVINPEWRLVKAADYERLEARVKNLEAAVIK